MHFNNLLNENAEEYDIRYVSDTFGNETKIIKRSANMKYSNDHKQPMALKPGMRRREFIKAATMATLCAGLPELTLAKEKWRGDSRLFPINLPGKDWVQFPAEGFSDPASGVIYRLNDTVTNGLALGGIDTGCLDFESNGFLGYCTIFSSLVLRRGPINLPALGLAVGDKTWALCHPPDGAPGTDLEPASAWLPGDLGADQPAWKSRTAEVPGWFRSLGRSHYDLPAGRIACHSPTVVRWTSPIHGDIRIQGGLWLARNYNRPQRWELWKNGGLLSSGFLQWGPTSTQPMNLAQGTGGAACLIMAVNEGDVIELVVGGNGVGDFVGVDLTIRTSGGDRSWDAAKDWSDAKDPNGPWTYDDRRRGEWIRFHNLLQRGSIGQAREIHYWGHYPVLDIEFETDAPISAGMRAWTPFLPGDVVHSMVPGIVFEMHLRNPGASTQTGAIALTFPGPTMDEAGTNNFVRQKLNGTFNGVSVSGTKASYALGVIGKERLRVGGELGVDPAAWSRFGRALPVTSDEQPGACAAVDFQVRPGEEKMVRFVLAWSAPMWSAGGNNSTGSDHHFTHMYAKYYPDAPGTAAFLAASHAALLRKTLAWQEVVYTDEKLPVWLRDSLINILYCITEDGVWAQRDEKLLPWVTEEDGLFGLNECPRGCPQIECIPCSFYGSQPLVYFFPELQLSTMRGYKHYQGKDGRPAWIFGSPVDMCAPNYTQYQASTNGISLEGVIDRFLMCHDTPDKKYTREFYPVIKKTVEYNVNLGIKGNPRYTLGEQVIAMPNIEGNLEWFETESPGWTGVAAHISILRLAQLGISRRAAERVGDAEFAQQCAEWSHLASESIEKLLWDARGYHLNWIEPISGKKSELVFGYQLDGQWVFDHHGLKSPLPDGRVGTVLDTIRKINVALSKTGAVNYANSDGTVANPGGYGTYSYFPPEALMLAMTYMYQGSLEFGSWLAYRVWHNLVCVQGYTWDTPNIMRGDKDTGKRVYGHDYYQNMMLWSLPAALEGKDFSAPMRTGGLVDRILKAVKHA
ncbi:MAG: hypothetical protein KGJ88_12155 [Verrucomicrobiota bacterium]|nr:hypothetical protein [Verrucomicrobiota bacterium]